jgi:D-3-phosphoglycerate dehydrogenase
MYKVLTLNNIRSIGLDKLSRERYEVASEFQRPDALLLRSYNLHDWTVPESLLAVARAGAGVNNIPIEALTQRGIAVFNTPGANANAVKELVVAGMLLTARNLCQAWDYTRQLRGSDAEINQSVEAGKKQFAGFELPGKTLGVVGLGAIGVRVANAAEALGMRVLGFDPHITINNAWRLSAQVEQVMSVAELLAESDFVSLHVPMIEETRHLINVDRLRRARPGLTLLNFARGGIVDEAAVLAALNEQRIRSYISDFPSKALIEHPNVITLPHLGASTVEAEENCAIMATEQLRDYLEHGTVRNSVNFPAMEMPRNGGSRLMVINANVPRMIERISSAIAQRDLNILDLLNRSRGEIACTLIDISSPAPEGLIADIAAIEGVLRVRSL